MHGLSVIPIVQRVLKSFTKVLNAFHPAGQLYVKDFWSVIRTELEIPDREIQNSLTTIRPLPPQVQTAQQFGRSSTSQSAIALRDTLNAELAIMAPDDNAAGSDTIRILAALPAHWALRECEKRRLTVYNPLDCWVSGNRSAHLNGYVKVNLRNTRWPDNSRSGKIGVSPFLHQLAIVGKGLANQLYQTSTRSGYEVSHLCHNGSCFNPAHLVIESTALNKARNLCKGLSEMKTSDGTIIHLCTHWETEQRRACMYLPTQFIGPEMRGKYLQMSHIGPIIKTSDV